MATWLTNHATFGFGNVQHNEKVAVIPRVSTIQRVVFNWHLGVLASDASSFDMNNAYTYGALLTLDSSNEASIPDPTAVPLNDPAYPTQRYLHWEARRMRASCKTLLANGSSGIIWADDGAIGEISREGQVYADVAVGHTLDVWLVLKGVNWPAYPSNADGSYWARVLYD
jgi:hypothetical protein